MFKLFFICILSLQISTAIADTEDTRGELRFYVPALAWKLSFPKSDWKVGQEKRRPDGTGFYYLATSDRRALNFSIFLDETERCSSGDSCRAMFWRNPGPMYKDPRNVKQYELNGFSVVQFYLDGVAGIPIKQTNLSAHMYKDGYWIDIHLSKIGEIVPNPDSMAKFLESISIK